MRVFRKNRDRSFHVSYAPLFSNLRDDAIERQIHGLAELFSTVRRLSHNETVLIADNGASPHITYLHFTEKPEPMPLENPAFFYDLESENFNERSVWEIPEYRQDRRIMEVNYISTLERRKQTEVKSLRALLKELVKLDSIIEIIPNIQMNQYGGELNPSELGSLLQDFGFTRIGYWHCPGKTDRHDELLVWHPG